MNEMAASGRGIIGADDSGLWTEILGEEGSELEESAASEGE